MSRIPQQKIDEIISAADIVSYVSRYVALKRTGKNLKGLCPFHKEKTPSFTVSPEKQFYHCFGCGKGGNLFGFLMDMEKLSYIEVIKKVAADLGITLPRFESERGAAKSQFEKLLRLNHQVKDFYKSELNKAERTVASEYLKKRKLKSSIIKHFELGYAPNIWDSLKRKSFPEKELLDLGLIQLKDNEKGTYDKFRNRLMFPFHDTSGRIVGFGGRALHSDQQPKYLNSPESPVYKKGTILYGLFQAADSIRKEETVILVEGYFDLLRLVDSGISNVVASSGTAVSTNQAFLLKRYAKRVIIAYDSDEAGIRAAMRNAMIMEGADLEVYMITIPVPDDPDSYILKNSIQDFKNLLEKKVLPVEFRLVQFKNKPDSSSMDQKKSFMDELLEDLTEIPNEVKIGLYIHRIAEVLEISESLLISRFNQMKRDRGRRDNFAESRTEEMKSSERPIRRGQWRAEETVLALLLDNNPNINKQILNQISTSDFANDELRNLFDHIAHIWEESGEIDVKELESIHDNYQNLLPKLKIIELYNPPKLAADCIYQIRKWELDTRFNEIKRLISEESSSDKSVLHYMKELSEIRKKLTEIEKERTKFVNTKL
jgi:DNA primase